MRCRNLCIEIFLSWISEGFSKVLALHFVIVWYFCLANKFIQANFYLTSVYNKHVYIFFTGDVIWGFASATA